MVTSSPSRLSREEALKQLSLPEADKSGLKTYTLAKILFSIAYQIHRKFPEYKLPIKKIYRNYKTLGTKTFLQKFPLNLSLWKTPTHISLRANSNYLMVFADVVQETLLLSKFVELAASLGYEIKQLKSIHYDVPHKNELGIQPFRHRGIMLGGNGEFYRGTLVGFLLKKDGMNQLLMNQISRRSLEKLKSQTKKRKAMDNSKDEYLIHK
jgi:hypothetical protein